MRQVADIGDITGLLHLLTDNGGSGTDGAENGSGNENSDFFGDIDPDMLIRILEIISKLSGQDSNDALFSALRPYLRPENREKLDRAAKIMKLIGIIPLLRDSGINLF